MHNWDMFKDHPVTVGFSVCRPSPLSKPEICRRLCQEVRERERRGGEQGRKERGVDFKPGARERDKWDHINLDIAHHATRKAENTNNRIEAFTRFCAYRRFGSLGCFGRVVGRSAVEERGEGPEWGRYRRQDAWPGDELTCQLRSKWNVFSFQAPI